jgi:predicted amidohydrolase
MSPRQFLSISIALLCIAGCAHPNAKRSPHGTLRVATAEMLCKINDVPANMDEACRLATEAGKHRARLVLFPEGCLTGNPLVGRDRQATIPCAFEPFQPLQKIADYYDMTISIGFATPFGQKVNEVHAIIRPGESILFQHKAETATGEPEFLAPWPDAKREIFTVDGYRVVQMICSEFGPQRIIDAMDAAKPDLVLHSSAGHLLTNEVVYSSSPTPDQLTAEYNLMRGPPEGASKDAARRHTPRLAANPIGYDGESYWPGNSYAVGADGQIYLWVRGTAVPSRMHSSIHVVDLPITR